MKRTLIAYWGAVKGRSGSGKSGKRGRQRGKIFRFAESLMKNCRFFIVQP
jgi:hypothetical protein